MRLVAIALADGGKYQLPLFRKEQTMNKTIIKSGPGRLYGVSNPEPQPGKMFKAYDGDTVLLILQLDNAFPAYEDIFGDLHPGIEANLVFNSLQVETDGKDVNVHWQ